MRKIQKIGHRGAKGDLAENTLESIRKAIDLKVDAVEIDVHLCKTGELVVIHDFTVDRTTNGEGEVSEKTLDELRSLLIEGKYRIPLLTEVLDLIEEKCRINIELKGNNTAAETSRIIRDYVTGRSRSYSDFIVSSFQWNELFEVLKIDTNIPLGVLTETNVSEAIEIGKKLSAKAIHPSVDIITPDNLNQARKAGFEVNVWTVNDKETIQKMKDLGVDGIISDFPDLL